MDIQNLIQSTVARMLAPVSRRVRLMVSRAVITAINDAGKVKTAQVKLLDGEVKDGIEILEQYGLNSVPPGQPESLYFSVGADRDHGVMISVADRKFRLKGLKPGEVALYDDLGQKVHFTREGIVIDGAGKDLTYANVPNVYIPGATVHIPDGDLIVGGISFMGHKHPENDSGGPTGGPQ